MSYRGKNDARLMTRAYRKSLPLVLPSAFYEYTYKLLTRQPEPWFYSIVEYDKEFPLRRAKLGRANLIHFKNWCFHRARDLHFTREYGTSYRKR